MHTLFSGMSSDSRDMMLLLAGSESGHSSGICGMPG